MSERNIYLLNLFLASTSPKRLGANRSRLGGRGTLLVATRNTSGRGEGDALEMLKCESCWRRSSGYQKTALVVPS
jgi:hypothetical protein